MKRRNEIDATLDELMTEMHRRVGVEYDVENCKRPDWYKDHTWTDREQGEFVDWGVRLLRKKHGMNKRSAEWEMGMFNLQWGWKTENDL